MKAAGLAALLALAASSAALAQAPAGPPPAGPPRFAPPARGPAMEAAVALAQAAVAACKANGYNVTALVVNSAGAPRVQISNDAAPDLTLAIATRKANTTIAFKEPSGAVGERSKTDAALADRIKNDPKLITFAGAQPLMSGAEMIGALAVSGAPGGDKDDACVTAAKVKVGALK